MVKIGRNIWIKKSKSIFINWFSQKGDVAVEEKEEEEEEEKEERIEGKRG